MNRKYNEPLEVKFKGKHHSEFNTFHEKIICARINYDAKKKDRRKSLSQSAFRFFNRYFVNEIVCGMALEGFFSSSTFFYPILVINFLQSEVRFNNKIPITAARRNIASHYFFFGNAIIKNFDADCVLYSTIGTFCCQKIEGEAND